jgi:hypothetical protein
MRHFLRTDGEVGVGPSLGAVVFVAHGDTLHLDETKDDEALVAEDISRHSSGWIEVDENGAAIPGEVDRTMPDYRRHRGAVASPEVINVEPIEPSHPEPDGELVDPETQA